MLLFKSFMFYMHFISFCLYFKGHHHMVNYKETFDKKYETRKWYKFKYNILQPSLPSLPSEKFNKRQYWFIYWREVALEYIYTRHLSLVSSRSELFTILEDAVEEITHIVLTQCTVQGDPKRLTHNIIIIGDEIRRCVPILKPLVLLSSNVKLTLECTKEVVLTPMQTFTYSFLHRRVRLVPPLNTPDGNMLHRCTAASRNDQLNW